MATAELVTAAMKKYPCIKKVFVHKITVVTNDINGRNMYRLPILLENGGKGYRHAFYYYVEAINM